MRHRDVAVLILHDHGKLLLQKRSKNAQRFPDSWGFFGGGIERGEQPIDALRRELREELELIVNSAMLVKEYEYELRETGEEGKIVAFSEAYANHPLVLHEGQDMRWVSAEEALVLEMHPVYREIVKEIVQGRISVVS